MDSEEWKRKRKKEGREDPIREGKKERKFIAPVF
jgi:hypothetical protein